MKLNDFAFIHDNVFKYALEILQGYDNWTELKNYFEKRFEEVYACSELFYSNDEHDKIFACDEKDASNAWFDSGLYDKEGNPIWIKLVLNKRQGFQKWFGMDFYPEYEMIEEILKNKYFCIGDIVFESFEDGLNFLEIVKEKVQPEEWKYIEYQDYSVNYPILKSYLEHTFKRLKQEGKLVESTDNRLILFNTGLLERNFLLDVYICCEKKQVKIFNIDYCLYTDPKLVLEQEPIIRKKFNNKIPEIAKYFTTIDEVIFNPELDIDLNWTHIFIERRDRIPGTIISDEKNLMKIVKDFRGNEDILKKLAKRNYKMVVPQYYGNKIQFLMPVYLGTDYTGKPDFALVLDLDENNGEKYYKGTTILTVEMAYQNARLLARPDNPWLTCSVKK